MGVLHSEFSEKETEKKRIMMEARIKEVYRKASKEALKTADKFFAKLPERFQKEYKAYLDGKYTQEQFVAWFKSQQGRGDRWDRIAGEIAEQIGEANNKAVDIINGTTPSIYSLSSTYTAYQIDVQTGGAFNLPNVEAINEMLNGENHTEFRVLSKNPQRNYEWNKDKIDNALISGMLQGKSIPRLADAFMEVMKNNQSAAVRNARTAATSAHNAGHLNACERAESMGLNVAKEWIATSDGRTRDSHAELNGIRVKPKEKFPNGLMCPGDPQGHPGEVYNCRCRMLTVLLDYDDAEKTGKTVESYKDWAMDRGYNPDRAIFTSKEMHAHKNENDNDMSSRILVKLNPNASKKAKAIANAKTEKETIQRIADLVSDYTNKESGWNGIVLVDNKMDSVAKYKWKTGIIKVRKDATVKNKIHEYVHSLTDCSVRNETTRKINGKLNEAVVECFAEEICKKNGIVFSRTYNDLTNAIREIASDIGIDEFELSKVLVETPYHQRYETLENLVKISGVKKERINNNLKLLYGV